MAIWVFPQFPSRSSSRIRCPCPARKRSSSAGVGKQKSIKDEKIKSGKCDEQRDNETVISVSLNAYEDNLDLYEVSIEINYSEKDLANYYCSFLISTNDLQYR